MADVKISALPSRSTPLTSATFPVVQGATTVQLTLADIRGGAINVKNYGAVGNGTTDDTAAIQAAVNAASACGLVFFPLGTYRLNGTISTSTRGLRFVGEGGQTATSSPAGSVIMCYSATAGIDFNNGGGLVFEGPHFNNLCFQNNTATTIGVRINNTDRWTFRDCSFRSPSNTQFFGTGIYLTTPGTSGSDNAWGMVDNCNFSYLLRGIEMASGFGFAIIGGTWIMGGANTNGIGILANNCGQLRAIGLKMDDQVGISLNNSNTNQIIGCSFEAHTTAIILTGSSTKHTIIANNIIGGATVTGVNIGAGVEYTALMANGFENVTGSKVINNGVAGSLLRLDNRVTELLGNYLITNGVTQRSLNVTTANTSQLAQVLGTLITDLKTTGIIH